MSSTTAWISWPAPTASLSAQTPASPSSKRNPCPPTTSSPSPSAPSNPGEKNSGPAARDPVQIHSIRIIRFLQRIVLHRRHKPRQPLPLRCSFHLDPHQILAFRPRFPQHHNRAQGLVVYPGHQECVPSLFFLPKLPNLNFPCAHILAIDCRYPVPHCQLSKHQPPTTSSFP